MAKKRTNPRTDGSNATGMTLPADYGDWLTSLKQRIQSARQRALLAANQEQIRLYHDIGREILHRQSKQGWGAKVIDRLSTDLRAAFPDMKGLSTSNLKYMRFFAMECPDRRIGQQSADQLPWFHIVTLITKLSDHALRDWYAREALDRSWPRDTLVLQIKNQLHIRQGAAVTNFEERLSPPQAGLAAQILKDPYHFDVRHDNRVNIADSVSRILGRRYLSRPTHLGSKDARDHSLLVKRRLTTKCPDQRAARLAG
jgi:predicted nuclease of restriction endonuclease-like (RecB) superfamily